jgi:hypothetical protein
MRKPNFNYINHVMRASADDMATAFGYLRRVAHLRETTTVKVYEHKKKVKVSEGVYVGQKFVEIENKAVHMPNAISRRMKRYDVLSEEEKIAGADLRDRLIEQIGE